MQGGWKGLQGDAGPAPSCLPLHPCRIRMIRAQLHRKSQGGCCICISSKLEAENPLNIDKWRLKHEGEEESEGIGEAKVADIERGQC